MTVAGDNIGSPFPEKEEAEQAAAANIAVLSVLKKGSILKNIFLNCPPRSSSDQGAEEEGCLRRRGVADEDVDEVSILIGRHPDCHIVLDHPSISRFHLELRLSRSEQKLSVVDRSSVHGTWVSGTKIPPNVSVNLVDGDSLRLGASTRVYRLQWVSASRAFEMENPLAPLPEEETYQDDSNYETIDANKQQDSEIHQESLTDEKNVEIFQDHAGHKGIDDINAQRILEIPSAPSMMEFMSPASKKIVEESAISSLVAPMLECFSSLFPLAGENLTSVSASSVYEEQSHEDPLNPLRSEKSMPSSLLSRRSKSKSISCLRIKTGRNKEGDENKTADIENREGTVEGSSIITKQVVTEENLYRSPIDKLGALQKSKEALDLNNENVNLMPPLENMKSTLKQKAPAKALIMEEDQSSEKSQQKSMSVSCLGIQTWKGPERIENVVADNGAEEGIRKENGGVCDQVDVQEAICRVLFDNLNGKEEDKDFFDSDKENITPMSSHQNMKKNTKLQQKSLDAISLTAEEYLGRTLQQKSRSNHLLRIQSGNKQRIEDTRTGKKIGGTRKENHTCTGQVKSQENVCRVLFDDFGGQKEDKQVFDSYTENVNQRMKKSNADCKSIAATLNVEEDMNSIVQQKSRSAICLRIQSGGSKERIEDTIADSGINEGTRKGYFTFCEQSEYEEMLDKVMLDSLGGQEEDKGIFESDKENDTPIPARQNMKNRLQQNSFAASLSMEEDFHMPRHMSSRNLCLKEEGSLTSDKESGVDSSHKSKASNVTVEESFTLGLVESMNNLDKAKWAPESISLKEVSCENSAKSYIEEGCSASDTEIMTPVSKFKLKDHMVQPHSINPSNVAQHLSDFSLGSVDVNEGTLSPEFNMKIEENGCSSGKENHTSPVSRSKTKELIFSDAIIGALSSEPMKIENEENGCSSDKENQTPQASKSIKKKKPLSETSVKIQREIMKKRVDRIPFQPLLETSTSRTQSNIIQANSASCSDSQKFETNNYLNQPTTAVPFRTGQEKKIWNILVDTDCLLNEESRKALQLLEGMKGTHLIVPRIVIRELDNLKRRESFFRKSTRACSVLQWIEDCMENVSWWIHVQSSFETVPVQPTPPVSPQARSSNGSNDDVSKPLAFSTYGSFVEIVSPTAEDHILDCALLFRKIKYDGHLVLLSNSTTLKIKAMAEGLLCETVKEFRESLVNPFSRRFLWVDSSPRGPTWSCNSEVGLFDNYYSHRPAVRKSAKVAEPARGLKLILLHNSHYGQFNSVK